jgi:hypothetical protein
MVAESSKMSGCSSQQLLQVLRCDTNCGLQLSARLDICWTSPLSLIGDFDEKRSACGDVRKGGAGTRRVALIIYSDESDCGAAYIGSYSGRRHATTGTNQKLHWNGVPAMLAAL